ncbi:MAG: DUF6364 family protein [Deltaproteobacteria bacterium]|nr:DUF6364 family protein [Deltaproteobacteria bacterium]
MDRQNITLSLPKDVLKKAKHLAVERGVSLSSLLSEHLANLVDEDRAYRSAAGRIKRRLKDGFDLGTRGRVTWTRDELHER